MKDSAFTTKRSCAIELDRADELASLRRKFHIPKGPTGALTYLCGHSLGLMPRSASEDVRRELKRWAQQGVDGHFDSRDGGWYAFHEQFAAPLAALTGARKREVVAMNSLTVNLHLLLASFYQPTAKRHAILIERGAFSSDRWAVQSQIRLHGYDPKKALLEVGNDVSAPIFELDAFESILRRHGSKIALVLLPGVQYLTGQALDIARLTKLAHTHGCMVGFDLAHAIGNTALRLHRDDVDFAVWCSYKYLNAGPGAIGGAFVHDRHGRNKSMPRLAGWWGHDKSARMRMPRDFNAITGAEGWQLSNPSVLAMAPLASSLKLFEEAGNARRLAKSEKLTSYLQFLLRELLGDRVEQITPTDPKQRGAQISIRLCGGRAGNSRLAIALRASGVVADFREPDVLRMAPVALYNRFADVYAGVQALEKHMR